MYKFLVDYRLGQIEIAIDSNDPNTPGGISYSDINAALPSMIQPLTQTIEANGGLYKGIDPKVASPIDINAALLRGATGAMPPFSFSVIEGELPIEASPDGDEQI